MWEYPQIFKYLWPTFYKPCNNSDLITWVSGIFPKVAAKGLLESGLPMNIQEGGNLEGRTVFYRYLRLESKSVVLFKSSSNSEMTMRIITYAASLGLRNGEG